MLQSEPTWIGRVRHVLGASVTVELDRDLAGTNPIWRGRLVSAGQIGSLVKIPQGPVYLLGTVVLVGISELTPPLPPARVPEQGDRWLQVQLLGEVDALGHFHRGVTTYPGLDDPVHFTTGRELGAIYPGPSSTRVEVGVLSASSDVPVTLDIAKLVTRHAAVVGSTGSGKTSAVSSLVQSLVAGGWTASNVVVIDPHGEYEHALKAFAASRSVLGVGDELLSVPYWALSAGELLWVLCGVDNRTTVDRFSELVAGERQRFADQAEWLSSDPDAITADSPIPYDLKEVWYQLDYANRATVTRDTKADCVEEKGDASVLKPASFVPYGPTAAEPVKGPTYDYYRPATDRLRLRLDDPKYHFFLGIPDPSKPDPLVEMISDWLGGDRPVSVLNFSGVPADAADVAIGVVLHLIFEIAVRGTDDVGIGRARPVLVVLEEAHRYLGPDVSGRLTREAVNRVAREGRKYGVGLLLVTQRPSELPDTVLAQCGTIVALRLTNSGDQDRVRAALPDSVAGLAGVLPSLRTGEALISGEAIVLPTRTALRRPEPEPLASDPTLDSWRQVPPSPSDMQAVVAEWRGQPLIDENATEALTEEE